MTRITVDPETRQKLRNLREPLEICDEAGQLLGYFDPVPDQLAHSQMGPQISDEEIRHRIEEGGGRPLAEILADLERSR